MKWFEHRHWWRTTLRNTLNYIGEDGTYGLQRVEQCNCGAVRTIEIYPGQDPVIRMAAPPSEVKP